MKLITFDDKESTKTSTKPRKNCITDQDINDIKSAINENANICVISSSEQKIGKLGNEDLYRIKLELNINFSLLANANLDISNLGAKEVFVNYNYSYYIDDDNNYIPLFNIAFLKSSYANFRNYSNAITKITNTEITFVFGSDSDFSKMVLTLEYTKNS